MAHCRVHAVVLVGRARCVHRVGRFRIVLGCVCYVVGTYSGLYPLPLVVFLRNVAGLYRVFFVFIQEHCAGPLPFPAVRPVEAVVSSDAPPFVRLDD